MTASTIPLPPRDAPLDQMVCFALYSATRAATQAYRVLLEPHGLTYPQYLVLVLLWTRGDQSVSQLGDALELDSGTLSPMLRRMEQADVITKTRSTDDDRVVVIGLTDHGRALRSDLAHVPACIADGTELTPESARDLIDTLRSVGAGWHSPQRKVPHGRPLHR